MKAITKTTPPAVLVTLGLVLAAWAAEPPTPEAPATASADPGPMDQTWELKTADTSLTVGRKGSTVYLCALTNPAKNHNWLPVPVAQSWVEKTQVQGAHTPGILEWTYQDAAVDTTNGTKVTLRFRNAKPSLELVSE